MMHATRPCCKGLSGDWGSWLQDMMTSWSKAGQQILLNQNQPLQMETGPGGTKIYQTGPGVPGAVTPPQPSTPEGVIQSSFSGLALLALAGIAIYLIMEKGD